MELSEMKALSAEWRKLKTALAETNKLDYELFKKTFEATKTLLCDGATVETVDKKRLVVIVDAYKFCSLDGSYKDPTVQASLILTERMLQHYVLQTHTDLPVPNGVYVYVLEARQELYVDFDNLDLSIKALSRALEKRY